MAAVPGGGNWPAFRSPRWTIACIATPAEPPTVSSLPSNVSFPIWIKLDSFLKPNPPWSRGTYRTSPGKTALFLEINR